MADIARDLTLAAEVPGEALPRLFFEHSVIYTALIARLVELQLTPKPSEQSAGDRLLNVIEAAERLGMKKQYLYRNSHKYTFTRRLAPGQLRFSSRGIDEFIQGLSR